MRVAVLAGGRSSEHEVSLASAESVREGLAEGGHEVVDVRLGRDGSWAIDGEPLRLAPAGGLAGADAVFPVLHGPFGEDGTVQGLLELLDVPYVGAGVLASSVAMDKAVFKDLMAAHGIPQVEYEVARQGARPLPAGAGVREAGPARLVGGHLEGPHRGRDRRRPLHRVRARPRGPRRALLRRARGGVLGARALAAGRLGARRDRDHVGRLVRLRGQVRARRDGARRAGPRARAGARRGAQARGRGVHGS